MHFLADYGFFLAKVVTVVAAIIAILIAVAATRAKSKGKDKGTLSIRSLNKAYDETQHKIEAMALSKAEQKAQKQRHKADKKAHKKASKTTKRLFVLSFHGDIKASAVQALREEVTAVLLAAKPQDEVLIRLDSPGGMVNAYGLAASQLQRIKAAGLKLTAAVDKVAASGGYMMACVADRIIAAPFAVIGSIGVVAQLPNFHRYLEKKQIDFEQITAGEYKRTLTVFGENTKKGREKMQAEVDDLHALFKQFILDNRPSLNLDTTATGEYWYGTRALALNLIDTLQTSDDYLLQARDAFDLYAIEFKSKPTLSEKLGASATALCEKLFYHSTLSTRDDL